MYLKSFLRLMNKYNLGVDDAWFTIGSDYSNGRRDVVTIYYQKHDIGELVDSSA